MTGFLGNYLHSNEQWAIKPKIEAFVAIDLLCKVIGHLLFLLTLVLSQIVTLHASFCGYITETRVKLILEVALELPSRHLQQNDVSFIHIFFSFLVTVGELFYHF